MIYIASDHGGFKLKTIVIDYFAKVKADFKDLGPSEYNEGDDYPDFAAMVSAKVSAKPKTDLGILICRSGQGMAIVANKYKNVRAAVVWNALEAKMSRLDDMANVLCLPSDYISPEIAQAIIETWLHTDYSQEARHLRRVKKISEIETGKFKAGKK